MLAGALFGTAGTAVTFAPNEASTSSLGFARLFVGALFLIALLPRLNGNRRALFGLVRHPLVWVMAICSAAYQPLFFGATQRNGVAISTLLTVGCIPIYTGIVGRIFRREIIKKQWIAATTLAIVGLAIRSWSQIELKNVTGVLMAVTAGISVSFYLNAAKSELQKSNFKMELPAVAYLLGSLFLIPLIISEPLSWVLRPSGFVVALYLGIVTMALANALQISGLGKLPAGPTATLMLADPFTATILGVVLLHEEFNGIALLGVILVAIALVWQSLSESRTKQVLPL